MQVMPGYQVADKDITRDFYSIIAQLHDNEGATILRGIHQLIHKSFTFLYFSDPDCMTTKVPTMLRGIQQLIQ